MSLGWTNRRRLPKFFFLNCVCAFSIFIVQTLSQTFRSYSCVCRELRLFCPTATVTLEPYTLLRRQHRINVNDKNTRRRLTVRFKWLSMPVVRRMVIEDMEMNHKSMLQRGKKEGEPKTAYKKLTPSVVSNPLWHKIQQSVAWYYCDMLTKGREFKINFLRFRHIFNYLIDDTTMW